MRVRLLCAVMLASAALAGCSDGSDTQDSPESTQPKADAGAEAAEQEAALPDDDGGADQEAPACDAPARKLWVYDLSVMPPKYNQVPATCRGAGPHVNIYVADSIWGGTFGEQQVNDALTAFESKTPADDSHGIWDIDTALFGNPPDVDGDGKIILFYHKIASYQSYNFDGFIRREDMLGGQYSNKSEVLYLDGVRNEAGSEYMLGIIAHEFQHMIGLTYDENEEGWLDETMSETGMVGCGYFGDLDEWVTADFARAPTQSLTIEPPDFNYGAGFLFGAYLYQQFGSDFIRALSENPKHGIDAINDTLQATGRPETFREVLRDWTVANFLDAPDLDNHQYGYVSFETPAMKSTNSALPMEETSLTLEPHSARYVVLDLGGAGASTVQVQLSTPDFAGYEVRYAVYPQSDRTKATVGAASLESEATTFDVPVSDDGSDRIALVIVQTADAKSTFKLAATKP